MMAVTKLDIYNTALAHIGQDQALTSETEDSTARRILDQFYTVTRDRLLYLVDWPFARTFATLAISAGTAPVGWLYQYARPADCHRPIYILGNTRSINDRVPFETATIGGTKMILTDKSDAELAYTRTFGTSDEQYFDPAFADSLSLGLAVRIALPVAHDGRIKSVLENDFRINLTQAIHASSRERVGEPYRNPEGLNDLTEIRF